MAAIFYTAIFITVLSQMSIGVSGQDSPIFRQAHEPRKARNFTLHRNDIAMANTKYGVIYFNFASMSRPIYDNILETDLNNSKIAMLESR